MIKRICVILLTLAAITAKAQTNVAKVEALFKDGATVLHSNAKVPIRVDNEGTAEITKLSYIVEDFTTGSVSGEQTVSLDEPIKANEYKFVVFKIPASPTTGKYEKLLSVTKVNGVPNEASTSNASTRGYVYTYSKKAERKTVEEEYTGTWCPWCPRGMVALEYLAENYPNTFIGIAYHYNDPMELAENLPHSGFPRCTLNSYLDIDPYFGTTGRAMGLEDDFKWEQLRLAEASVDLFAKWKDDNKNEILITTRTNYYLTTDEQYSLTYIITEDSMYNSSWAQANSYSYKSEYKDDPYMSDFYHADFNVYGLYFNHVAVATAGLKNGVENAISLPVEEGVEQTHEYTMDISNRDKIQNKDHLKLIAILKNTTQGKVANANAVKILPPYATGIETATTDNIKEVGRYTADGRKIQQPVRGLNIIKMSDGTTRKVFVK